MGPGQGRSPDPMTDLLVFGGDSLVGSHFVQTTRHHVIAMGRRDPRTDHLTVAGFERLDFTDTHGVEKAVRRTDADIVVNFAAVTDVDEVERERPATAVGAQGYAYLVNTAAPEAIARASRDTGKFFISLSTDFVFDGAEGPYSEDAEPAPFSPRISWYGWTKGEGERRIRSSYSEAAVIRIAYPYRTAHAVKLDFARKIIDGHRRHARQPYFSDQQITPTWIPDVSRSVEHLIGKRKAGTFHVASPALTTPYQFACEILSYLGIPSNEVTEGSMETFLQRSGITPRPRRGGLICRRLAEQGVPLTSWRDGIRLLIAEGGGS
jgi:dTDP-4-dehydrorhamnose reductase